jgi:protein O-GlcNAc transferase
MTENIKDLFEEGFAFHKANQLNQARKIFEKVLEQDKNHINAIYLLATIFGQEKKYQEALDLFNRGIAIKDDVPELFYNQGIVLNALGRFNEAIQSYEMAIKLKPDLEGAYLNLGFIFQNLQQYQEAIIQYDKVLSLNPKQDKAYFFRATCYLEMKNFNSALKDFEKVKGSYTNFLGLKTYTKLSICQWDHYEEEKEKILEGIREGINVATPFISYLLTDKLDIQLEAGKLEIGMKYSAKNDLGPIQKYQKKQKIKIAYFSFDFNNTPISFLTLGLFQLHDKNNFEIFGFSLNPAPKDFMQESISRSCSQFINVSHMSDIEVAKLARELEIDIAIDLNGHVTTGARPGIFSYRAAPIQINFLGNPGTIGSEYHDFIIADKVIIPEQFKKYYSEKIIYLPDSYFVNSHASYKFSKNLKSLKELNLPSDDFIFCCFNNTFKITPEVFDSWMRILRKVPHSVLWLIKHSDDIEDNLKKIAIQNEIEPTRLIFTQRSTQPDYYSWYQYADLFLDTFPYNAHTTGLDSLWLNVPIVTRLGDAFASRVCASQLTALNLSELICDTQEAYEDMAIDLALNERKLMQIKKKLEQNAVASNLFNTLNFTKGLEKAYQELYAQYQNDIGFKELEILL